MPKPLPIGTQTFRDIIDGGFLYVDKTQSIFEIIRHFKGVYFLSRPRRFGKSLFISTLAEIFKGHKELFRDLWLYTSDYTWPTHPVIRIDFSQERVYNAEGLTETIKVYLQEIAANYGITLAEGPYDRQFRWLIQQLAIQGKVVILIDEYDKPIIDNLENTAEAKRIQEVLKNFYTVIKAMDEYLRFVFITGISKFSRIGIFSGLNNLVDVSLNGRFATALGLTEAEIVQNFQAYIADFAAKEGVPETELLAKIRYWYNGFCFAAEGEKVYNPFSTLLLFYHQRFANYWFESGTPTFLIKLIKAKEFDIQQFNEVKLREISFSTYEIENLAIIPLLFQTGYLTIKGYEAETQLYTLAYPNYEVEEAFST